MCVCVCVSFTRVAAVVGMVFTLVAGQVQAVAKGFINFEEAFYKCDDWMQMEELKDLLTNMNVFNKCSS